MWVMLEPEMSDCSMYPPSSVTLDWIWLMRVSKASVSTFMNTLRISFLAEAAGGCSSKEEESPDDVWPSSSHVPSAGRAAVSTAAAMVSSAISSL